MNEFVDGPSLKWAKSVYTSRCSEIGDIES